MRDQGSPTKQFELLEPEQLGKDVSGWSREACFGAPSVTQILRKEVPGTPDRGGRRYGRSDSGPPVQRLLLSAAGDICAEDDSSEEIFGTYFPMAIRLTRHIVAQLTYCSKEKPIGGGEATGREGRSGIRPGGFDSRH